MHSFILSNCLVRVMVVYNALLVYLLFWKPTKFVRKYYQQLHAKLYLFEWNLKKMSCIHLYFKKKIKNLFLA